MLWANTRVFTHVFVQKIMRNLTKTVRGEGRYFINMLTFLLYSIMTADGMEMANKRVYYSLLRVAIRACNVLNNM